MILGVTGGVASGKSTVMRMLEERGAVTFSADDAYRAVLTPGGPLLQELVSEFGREILAADGTLDRARLGSRIFSDSEDRARLNRLVHPAILRLLRAQIDAAEEDAPLGTIVAVEVPLLFETNLAGWFERIVVVTASESTQIARLKARNELTAMDARNRLDSQWPISKKAERADFVVCNDGSLEDLELAVGRLWAELMQSGPGRERNP